VFEIALLGIFHYSLGFLFGDMEGWVLQMDVLHDQVSEKTKLGGKCFFEIFIVVDAFSTELDIIIFNVCCALADFLIICLGWERLMIILFTTQKGIISMR